MPFVRDLLAIKLDSKCPRTTDPAEINDPNSDGAERYPPGYSAL